MLNNFRNLNSLFWSHGSRWLLFRVSYALRKRTGYIRLQMPIYRWKDRPLATWLKKDIPSAPQAYAEWRRQNSLSFFRAGGNEAHISNHLPWTPQTAVDEAERVLSGELKYFSRTYYQVGFPPDWHRDPVTGTRLDSKKHWSEISNDEDVDLKFIWEPSRFGMVYSLIRAYASTRDERYTAAFWELVQAWAEANPPNSEANWMDGQEAALRLLAWMFGFHAFLDSPSSTAERIAQFTVMVAAHAERIYRNIDYAISTQSNHVISEAFGLWLAGLLFPELKNADKYLSLGRKLLEQEAAAQIFPDGSYSMYSLNYHRFILQIYLCAIRLAEINPSPFSNLVYHRVESSIDYLSQLIDPETGQMPVYGSNDGALVLPLNNCDFTDYRPLLQLGSYITRKKYLFEPGPWDEDIFWLCGADSLSSRSTPRGGRERARVRENSHSSFPHGGTYLLRGLNSKAFIRCTDPRARPSHADQLHVDLWIHGRNVACDAGTYLYSGEGNWRNGLAHTAVHNTVTVDRLDQMKMLTRFTWTNWSHGKVLRHDQNIWQGEHDGYSGLSDPVNHKRTVMSLPEDRWLVVDHLMAEQSHHYALQWLLCNGDYGLQELAPAHGVVLSPLDSKLSNSNIIIQAGLLEGNENFSIARADPNSTRGWRSQYYGHKEPAISVVLETDQSTACFWTYFGFEGDKVKLVGKTLNVGSGDWKTSIHLDEIIK
ncbi:MAG TPA: alginate lyase family protein [Anaerolineales bacterium]|nr:alginate lyase family protein [Anaerolineales bacterium]